jgi:hypothetical protein
MFKIRSFVTILCLVVVCGCFERNITKVNPSVKIEEATYIDEPIQIYFGKNVHDNVKNFNNELGNSNFREVKESLKMGFMNSYKDLFKEVKFVDKKPSTGLVLDVQKAIPEIRKAYTVSNMPPLYRVGSALKYKVIIFKDGKELDSTFGTVHSSEKVNSTQKFEPLYKNVIEVFIKKIAKKFFS